MNEKNNILTPSQLITKQNFGAFYTTYYKRFFRYAYYYVNDKQTAEDITHDALIYYWENKEGLSPETDVIGYILLTLRNKCLNYLKHLQVEADYNEKFVKLHEWEVKARIMTLEDADYTEIFSGDIIRIMTESLAKLPLQTREIFLKHRMENKPRKDIAREMGVSLQKIDYHINKANMHLAKDLKDYLPILLIIFCKIF
ncbi:MAG: RNA polymerase sigma-70 factor [Tannerellaceae bacterium]|nr:RNA polymerase sigma-70 factor [Tannerellaceae bacterium]